MLFRKKSKNLKNRLNSSKSAKCFAFVGAIALCLLVACDDDNVTGAESGRPVVGTMTDSRDGQTYKTVTIGTQTWMAENLNYAYTGIPLNYIDTTSDCLFYFEECIYEKFTSDSTSWCYYNDPDNCTKYGRLYSWAAAMDSVGTWSTNGRGCGYGKTCSPTYPVRGVCPEGWHLPDSTEWQTLFAAVGGYSTAGRMLQSTSGWAKDENGLDAYSFSVLPAGGYHKGNYSGEGINASFWSSTEIDSVNVYLMGLTNTYVFAGLVNVSKLFLGRSVRCVKD